jgi:hypothetical protein
MKGRRNCINKFDLQQVVDAVAALNEREKTKKFTDVLRVDE